MLNIADHDSLSAQIPINQWVLPNGRAPTALNEISVIAEADLQGEFPDLVLWDNWPIQCDNGEIAMVEGGTLWVVLSAPRVADPDARHVVARMRLLHHIDGQWRDCGNLLPDHFSPGSREWSGSTRLDPQTGEVTLWFTAAGRRGEAAATAEQRIFEATGWLSVLQGMPSIGGWINLRQVAVNDGTHYADLAVEQGEPSRIKGYRDPSWFRDPKDGQGYLLFTASKPASSRTSSFDGVIGIARADGRPRNANFTLLPPIIDADGLVTELELPHMLARDGRYYLFWSCHGHVFAPALGKMRTGLYGMVGPTVFGPFEPLNGNGLVLANPAAEPRQAYGWHVLPTLEVIGFVDYWGLEGRDIASDVALKSAQFGGTIAPMVTIAIDGSTTRIVSSGV